MLDFVVRKVNIMLIQNYDLELFTPPCHPGAERYAATARLMTDISEVLPYLNATLEGALFHHEAKALIWKHAEHKVAFHAYEISISNVEDREAAGEELKSLIALVNRTWEQRGEITPSYETRPRPTPMAVYKLLPQTNCRQCDEPTCFSFALKLVASQKPLSDCPALFEPRYAENLVSLRDMLVDLG